MKYFIPKVEYSRCRIRRIISALLCCSFWFSLTRWNDFYGISIICCVIAVVFTLYSIIYQIFILQKGCMLCMLVNLSSMGQYDYSFYVLRNYFDIVFSFYSFFAFATIGCICLILGIQLRTIQNKEKERISIKKHFSGLFNRKYSKTTDTQSSNKGRWQA